jgi:hypothetical protein
MEMRKFMLGALVCGLAASATFATDRVNVSEKGSLLIFPKVEIELDATGAVLRDTFITMTNDWNEDDVNVQMYFVNGDVNTAGCIWQCPFADADLTLTADQPAYWSVNEGRAYDAVGLNFDVLLNDPSGSGNQIARGYIIAYAVDNTGAQIRWNHLFGEATIVDYVTSTAYTYHAYSFRALTGANGDTVGTAGVINLDGSEYDYTFDILLFNFFADGSEAFSNVTNHPHDGNPAGLGAPTVTVESELSLMVVDQDFVGSSGRQPLPPRTLARATIWNENETKLTNTIRCISCWDNTILGDYANVAGIVTNWFRITALGTDMGKAEIDGQDDRRCDVDVCPTPADDTIGDDDNDLIADEYPLLGVIVKHLDFAGMANGAAGNTLNGKGTDSARLDVSLTTGGGPADEAPGVIEDVNGSIDFTPSVPSIGGEFSTRNSIK